MADETTNAELETFREEIWQRIQAHLAETPYRLNPNERSVTALVEGLARRKEKFGDYYCPCRVVTGDEQADRENVCPCASHEEEIAESGKCHCGLFFAKEPT